MTRDVEELQRDGSPLDDATLRRVLTNFQALDKDGDGHLTPGEFREGLGMLGMDEGFCRLVFDTFDTQGDGRIDQREFVTNMAVMLHPENLEAQISLAFDAYDVNKDGKLTEGELRQVIACVFSALDKMGLTNEHSSEDVADELFKQLDADGKGHVTKADYVRLARTKPDTFRQIGLGLASPMSQRRSRRVSSVSSGKHVLASSGGDGDRGTDGTSASSSGRLRTRRGRKRGNTVTFGHQNFELVVQMMLGIRLAAGKANEAPPPDLAQLQASRSHSMKAREREQREAGASTAAQPAAAAAGAGASEELPAGWSRGTDDSGHPFYRHAQTKEVRYTRPRRRSADLSGSSSSGSHRGGVVDAEAASSSTPHDGSDWHYAEPSIVILKKASKDGKCGITLSSTSNAVGHTFVEAMAAGGPAAASHKVFVGDLVLAVNSVPCEGCSSGCRVMREADGEVRLLIRAKISDHGYGDCAKFTIPSHTRGVDRTVEFKDYAPQVFRKIRALFGVPEREYMMSLGPEQVRNSDAILAQFCAILRNSLTAHPSSYRFSASCCSGRWARSPSSSRRGRAARSSTSRTTRTSRDSNSTTRHCPLTTLRHSPPPASPPATGST